MFEGGLTLALAAALLHVGREDEKFATSSGLPEVMASFLRRAGPVDFGTPALRDWATAIKAVAENVVSEEEFWAEAIALGARAAPALDRIRDRVLLWYDFASMFQAPRSGDEEREFRREILELNAIQAHAATVVIAGDRQYLWRAWCFLELCGGMRHEIVELTPSWGDAVGLANPPRTGPPAAIS